MPIRKSLETYRMHLVYIKYRWQSSLTLCSHSSASSIASGKYEDCIPCPHRADCKSLLVDKHWRVHKKMSLKSSPLLLQQVMFWIITWIIYDRRQVLIQLLFSVVLLPVFVQKKHLVLSNSYLCFSLCILLASMWYTHTIVLGRKPFLFYQIDQISIWSMTCK